MNDRHAAASTTHDRKVCRSGCDGGQNSAYTPAAMGLTFARRTWMRTSAAASGLLAVALVGAAVLGSQAQSPTPQTAVSSPQGRGGGPQGPGGPGSGRGRGMQGASIAPGEECPPGMTEVRPGFCSAPELPPPSIVDYRPRSTLVTKETPVPRAKFPVIDIHNHTTITPENIDE